MKDPREETTLKRALEALVVDLRAELKELGIEPKGNDLFNESELQDLTASHQILLDPQHCDGGVKPADPKVKWVDANESDYPLKVAKAYWNAAQHLKRVLEVKGGWSAVSVYADDFATAQKKMNECFSFLDDTNVGKDFRTQTPQVVDQRTLRVAKIYKKFVDTMVPDEDPLLAVRLSAEKYTGGKLAASTINSFTDTFREQFRLAQRTLEQRIGIYDARLNKNLLIEGEEGVVFRREKLRWVLQQILKKPQDYRESVEKAVSTTRQFLEGEEYREMSNTEVKIKVLEERLQVLENIVEVDVDSSIAEIEKQKQSLDSLYSIRDLHYLEVICSNEPASDVIALMDSTEKNPLRKDYDDAVKALEENRKVVEQKRAELNVLKLDLQRELIAQKALQKKESMPLIPTMNLSQGDISSFTVDSLQEAQEIFTTIREQSEPMVRSRGFFKAVSEITAVFESLKDAKKSITALNQRLGVVRTNKEVQKEILEELKGASLPLSEALFSKIKQTLHWGAEDEKRWEFLKKSQGVVGRLGVMVRYATDPIVQITQAVSEELAKMEKEESHLQEQIGRFSQDKVQLEGECRGLMLKAEVAFSQEIRKLISDIGTKTQDSELLQIVFEVRKEIEVFGEQLFGKNEAHQQLFSEFDQRLQAIIKPKMVVEEAQNPLQDPDSQQRSKLYEQYFGEKGLASSYIGNRSSFSIYSIKDKLQKAVTKKSDVEERSQFLSEIREILQKYKETGDMEHLAELRLKIHDELQVEKKFPPRKGSTPKVDSMLKSKKQEESGPNLKTLWGVLEQLDGDLKQEVSSRAKMRQEPNQVLKTTQSSKK